MQVRRRPRWPLADRLTTVAPESQLASQPADRCVHVPFFSIGHASPAHLLCVSASSERAKRYQSPRMGWCSRLQAALDPPGSWKRLQSRGVMKVRCSFRLVKFDEGTRFFA
ncbi:hypothetical protein BDA96_09G181600 [Sorghum bicolor]|uniref:Uncharacterized protein n=1 Tax=Sorghum bicolor TaxID=4558 RepID=A0A921QDU6_SORBI|nr:hypothetical protein BDA96_09G181600 [Sorghum bicolor]